MRPWSSVPGSYSGYMKVALVGVGATASVILLAKAWKAAYPPTFSLEAEILDSIASPKLFTLQELKAATRNFSELNLLSDTKLGRIYEGKLPTGAVVSVKVLLSGGGSNEEFRREVSVIGGLRHRNIITLEGFCMEDGLCALVYPHMPHTNLKTCLFGEGAGEDFLWPERYKVAVQIARALAHLHHEVEHAVCHRNLKLSSVLITDKKVVKISNFGLACYQERSSGTFSQGADNTAAVESKDSSVGSNNVSFSLPIPPVPQKEEMPTVEWKLAPAVEAERVDPLMMVKDDIYSFGVILLQLVTGRKVHFDIEGRTWHIGDWVWESVEKWQNWGGILDSRLRAFDKVQAEVMVVLGLHCCQVNTRARPDMAAVLQTMNGDSPLPELPVRAKYESFEFPQFSARPAPPHPGSSGSSNLSFDCWAGLSGDSQQTLFKVPYSRNLLFRGRESSLRQIREAFDTATLQAPCVSIYGLGGVGKTQLAIEYAYRNREAYCGVLWVDAADDVEANYASLARVLKLKIPSSLTQRARVDAVRNELEGERKYLLILDNINESSFETLRPKVGASHVLITTRIHLVYIIPLRLDVMEVSEALEVLVNTGGMPKWAGQTAMLEEIANELGLLPLALSAAGQLLSNGHDPVRLLEKIKQDVGRTLERAPPDLTFRKSSSLSELFQASLDQLSGEQVPDGDLARAIFFVGGFFSPDAIPLPLLTVAAQYFLGREPESDEDGEMAIMQLVRLSLAVRDNAGDVVFHRVLQAYSTSKTSHQSTRSAVLRALVRAKCVRKTAPHYQHLWKAYKELVIRCECPQEEEPLVAILAHNLAEYYATFQSSKVKEGFEGLDVVMAMGPARAGTAFFDIAVSKLFLLTRKRGNEDKARELLASTLQAAELAQDAALARQALLIYDKQLNWKAGDVEMERELHMMAQHMLKNARLLEKVPKPVSAGAWGAYYFNGREYGTAGTALELLGWMFTTLVPDPRFALICYGTADSIFSEQPWGSGAVGYLYARLEREARICRLISLAFSLPCGCPLRTLQDALSLLLANVAPALATPTERSEKQQVLKRNVTKTTEWIRSGLGNVRSTMVLAVELGELGLVTGGQGGKALIRKASGLLEKELPAIEKLCGADSVEVSTALYRLATLHRYLGPPNGLRQARRIMETRMAVEEEQQLSHRETRFHFLLAQVYFEQGLLKPAQTQLQLALRLSRGSDSWRKAKVLELLAAVAWLKGDAAAAAAHVDRAAAITGENRHPQPNDIDLSTLKRIIRRWQEGEPPGAVANLAKEPAI